MSAALLRTDWTPVGVERIVTTAGLKPRFHNRATFNLWRRGFSPAVDYGSLSARDGSTASARRDASNPPPRPTAARSATANASVPGS
jgi:hypothetical protein